MSEVLRPFAEFAENNELEELAEQLQRNVTDGYTQEELIARGLGSFVWGYGSDSLNSYRTVKADIGTRGLESYAVLDDHSDVIGVATTYSGPILSRLRLPIPGLLGENIYSLHKEFPYASPKITAWVGNKKDEYVAKAYSGLASKEKARIQNYLQPIKGSHSYSANTLRPSNPCSVPWAMEPTDTPEHIKRALVDAGFMLADSGRFSYAQEHKWNVPSRSNLYVLLPHIARTIPPMQAIRQGISLAI